MAVKKKTSSKKNIVILGAGFAGIRIAKDLSERLKNAQYRLILVDQRAVHTYTPDLYEVASNFHEKITEECLVALRETVATPITSILKEGKVEFIQASVQSIDAKKREIRLSGGALKGGKSIPYFYLAAALGSSTNYQNIKGLEQFSYPVKSLEDAVVINCHLDTYFRELWKKEIKKQVVITIGGGGATGVEFGSELVSYLARLCKKYHYPRSHIRVQVIQGSRELIGAGKNISKLALKRLKNKGIHVIFGCYVAEAGPGFVLIQDKKTKKIKKIPSDMLMWTGGVKVNPVIAESLGNSEQKGAILLNQYLESVDFPGVFAAGDNAAFIDPVTQERCPLLAQAAIDQGRVVAGNILRKIEGRDLKPYRLRTYPLIIPIAGEWGIVRVGRFVFHGRIGWLVRRLTDLHYALSILPFWKALRKWWHGNMVFMEND